MNKKLLALLISIAAIGIPMFFFHLADVTSLVVRTAAGVNLSKKGVLLEYRYIAKGLRQKPFILPFSNSISKFSRGALDIDVINTYTVGGYDKDAGSRIGGVANFLDPTSKFKDSWFGAYIVMDDAAGNGRRFMLVDREEPPDDINNLNTDSLLELTRLDQAVVVHTTHQGQSGYSFEWFIRNFPFSRIEGSEFHDVVMDKSNKPWIRITASFDTVSGLTDIDRTSMSRLASIRTFVGLPDSEVYSLVDPWHKTVLRGATLARYFSCPRTAFWAVVYYNGAAFTTKNGRYVDTWEQTDIRKEFEKMFMELEIGCAE